MKDKLTQVAAIQNVVNHTLVVVAAAAAAAAAVVVLVVAVVAAVAAVEVSVLGHLLAATQSLLLHQ